MTPVSPCLEAGCPNFADPNGRGRCGEHYRARERERNRERRRRAPGFNANGMKWRRTSRRYRFENPVCEACGKRLSEHVHHKRHYYGADPYSFDGLEALCAECHGKRHAEEGSETP